MIRPLMIFLFLVSSPAFADMYTWEDESGMHASNNINDLPEHLRPPPAQPLAKIQETVTPPVAEIKPEPKKPASKKKASAAKPQKPKVKETIVSTGLYEQAMAYEMAKSIISQGLKAPSTAKFQKLSDAVVNKKNTGYWDVYSYVDSQNSFGAMLRSKFYIRMIEKGDRYVAVKVDFY